MTTWIESARLLELVEGVDIRGRQSPKEVILSEPTSPVFVSEPDAPPLDVETYEVRRQRAGEGVGPLLTGMDEFVDVLANLDEPARIISIGGEQTRYIYLVDADLSRVLAGLAIDSP